MDRFINFFIPHVVQICLQIRIFSANLHSNLTIFNLINNVVVEFFFVILFNYKNLENINFNLFEANISLFVVGCSVWSLLFQKKTNAEY